MDQDLFMNFGKVELDGVKLDQAPLTADEYLKQVMLDRSNQADTVRVEVPERIKLKSRQTFSINNQDFEVAPEGYAPPQWWQDTQVADFSELRQKLGAIKSKMNAKGALVRLNYPDVGNIEGWKSFCLEKYSKQIENNSCQDKPESSTTEGSSGIETNKVTGHKGTPPLLKVVLPMSQPQVVDLLTYQIQWLNVDGQSSEIMRWIFALLCMLEKPLDPDMCASLRTLARICRTMRNELEKEDIVVREFSWFICIIGRYFDQNDLADQTF